MVFNENSLIAVRAAPFDKIFTIIQIFDLIAVIELKIVSLHSGKAFF